MNNEALSENSPVGQSVYKLEGINSFGNDNDLLYGIEGTDHLVVDSSTGIVTIAKPLDHEVCIVLIFFQMYIPVKQWLKDPCVLGKWYIKIVCNSSAEK